MSQDKNVTFTMMIDYFFMSRITKKNSLIEQNLGILFYRFRGYNQILKSAYVIVFMWPYENTSPFFCFSIRFHHVGLGLPREYGFPRGP